MRDRVRGQKEKTTSPTMPAPACLDSRDYFGELEQLFQSPEPRGPAVHVCFLCLYAWVSRWLACRRKTRGVGVSSPTLQPPGCEVAIQIVIFLASIAIESFVFYHQILICLFDGRVRVADHAGRAPRSPRS